MKMTPDKEVLWQKILDFQIDDPDAAFSFTDRLARENDWPLEFALRCVQEYKRFIFLACISDQPCTPSDEVDQVWHLHLLYTRSYWNELCRDTLGKEIHHGPTKGGQAEKTKYINLYEETKKLYEGTFESAPPEDIWPPCAVRFGNLRFTRVNRHRNWVLPKPMGRRKNGPA